MRTGSGGDVDLVAELQDAVAQHLPDDVAVRPAPDGFAVGYPEPLVMRRAGTRSATCLWAEVACDAATMTYTITDVVTAGDISVVGGLGASASLFRGRIAGDRRVREYGRRPDGTRGLLSEQVHSPRTLHAAVREAASALGWQERQPASAVIGKVVGIGTAALVVVAGLVVGALALAGRLG